jgi:FKBP-type peptidyl-prolyl cis-trans isomerase
MADHTLAAPGNADAVAPNVANAPVDAERAASGLLSKVLVVGTGRAHPGMRDQVKIACTGWTRDGQRFMSFHHHPLVFPIYRAIPGLVEGLPRLPIFARPLPRSVLRAACGT